MFTGTFPQGNTDEDKTPPNPAVTVSEGEVVPFGE